jgi:hypothetical protein
LRHGARAEVADFLAKHASLKTEDGRQTIVRHSHLPERAPSAIVSSGRTSSPRRFGSSRRSPLGFWKTNVLAKLPRQPAAENQVVRYRRFRMAETKAAAFKVKYEKAAECLNKDRDVAVDFLRPPR